jgi:hypothetical protein
MQLTDVSKKLSFRKQRTPVQTIFPWKYSLKFLMCLFSELDAQRMKSKERQIKRAYGKRSLAFRT